MAVGGGHTPLGRFVTVVFSSATNLRLQTVKMEFDIAFGSRSKRLCHRVDSGEKVRRYGAEAGGTASYCMLGTGLFNAGAAGT